MCEICSKLTIRIPEQYHWRRSGVFVVSFEQILLTVLVFPLLTLNNLTPSGIKLLHIVKNLFLLLLMLGIFFSSRPIETGRRWLDPQNFAKVDFLPIENDTEKKEDCKKLQTNLNFFKVSKNWKHYYWPLHVMHKTNILTIYLLYCVFHIFYNDDHHFEK